MLHKFSIDACRAMTYLHSSVVNMVHRDLKSPNLLITDEWTLKVGGKAEIIKEEGERERKEESEEMEKR